ncbi:MAG TPA: tetratricopeptide repeat-containing protein, partial [Croceibacterium sp.]
MTSDECLRQITRLARSGAVERAWALLEASGLAGAVDDPRALTLKGRLEKDRARQINGAERIRWLERAADHYWQAAEIGGRSYPLINAATLSLLAGKPRKAHELARRVLDLLDAEPNEPETPYWLGATRAEALLLLGRPHDARAALRVAVKAAPQAWEDRAATIGQFRLICAELRGDLAWLDQFLPPRSLQYAGVMAVGQQDQRVQGRIAAWLANANVGFGYGALAAGADIWIAEALVARGAELHVVLPCPVEVFRDKSVAAVDQAGLPRFDRLLEAAASLDELDAAPAPSPAAVGVTDAVALGLAMHNARILQSEALRLRIVGEAAPKLPDEPVRGATLAVARQAAAHGFAVGEAGVARAMLRPGSGVGA